MSPSIQNSIVVDWLAGIDEDLVEEVEQYYARDLENVSLVDMQETIAQGLPALLGKIKTKKEIGSFRVQLEKQVSAGAVRQTQGGRGGGGRYNNALRTQRQGGQGQSFAPRREPCSLCKSYGFTLRAKTNSLKDCFALQSMQKKERGMLAMQINSTIDGTEMQDNEKEGDEFEHVPWLDGDSSD